jgi:hypothetical protein
MIIVKEYKQAGFQTVRVTGHQFDHTKFEVAVESGIASNHFHTIPVTFKFLRSADDVARDIFDTMQSEAWS